MIVLLTNYRIKPILSYFIEDEEATTTKEDVLPTNCKIPVGFLIDETCSLSESSFSISGLSKQLIRRMQIMESKISKYILVTVNDKSYKPERNVKLKIKTRSANSFMVELDKIKLEDHDLLKISDTSFRYKGGGDKEERITQGLQVIHRGGLKGGGDDIQQNN